MANEPETLEDRNYTEGCKSGYTVTRVIQSKTAYLLLHPSVYQRGYRKLKASSYCGLTGRSEDLTRFLPSVLAVAVYPEQNFYRLNVVK